MPSSIEARLRRVERRVKPETSQPWAWVVTQSDDQLPGKLAEMEAAGAYKWGWNVIHWRVVSPQNGGRPCATLS